MTRYDDRLIMMVIKLLEVILLVYVMQLLCNAERDYRVIIVSVKTHIKCSINIIRFVFCIIIQLKLCKIIERYGIVPIFRC